MINRKERDIFVVKKFKIMNTYLHKSNAFFWNKGNLYLS